MIGLEWLAMKTQSCGLDGDADSVHIEPNNYSIPNTDRPMVRWLTSAGLAAAGVGVKRYVKLARRTAIHIVKA